MLFNSYIFIFLFLPIVWSTYIILQKTGLKKISLLFLVGASLFFYGYWNPAYLPLLIGSLAMNFIIGKALERKPSKLLLAAGIAFNLGLLGYYKYVDFFLETINRFVANDFHYLNLVLPLAISFYTFQQIAFLVDAYRGETVPYNLLEYVLFVTFFPQLIAGPIVQHNEIIPQFRENRLPLVGEHTVRGLLIFFTGLFKKTVIADSFAVWANKGFNQPESLTVIDSWITSLSYTFQLYFDFSGYCDMAVGAALLFNIQLPINFNSPYKALTIQDFWKRWHMTLNRFLTKYLYYPLGGSRKGKARTYMNVMIVFFLSGLWHGAGWTFIIWGLLHGTASVVYRIWTSLGFHMHKVLAWIVTFQFVNLTWVFFRAESVTDALTIIQTMFAWEPLTLEMIAVNRQEIITVAVFLLVCLLFKNSNRLIAEERIGTGTTVAVAAFTVFGVLSLNRVSEFLYYNF